MTAAILTRTTPSGTLYLTWRFGWAEIPDLFPAWHFPVVVRSMTGRKNPQRATGWAIVDDSKPIDLDKLEIMPL